MTLRRLLRTFLTAVLVFSLMPGVPEVLENVEHLLHDGHLAHSEQHEAVKYIESHGDGLDEHGCTPMAHRCGCHASMIGLLPDPAPGVQRSLAPAEDAPIAVERIPTARANAPPTPPPIAREKRLT
jgi:hypothetical protein